MKYLISGGGTGGHIYPALAIADGIKNRDKDANILYVGTDDGLEKDLVPKEGLKFETIRVRGLPRKISLKLLKAIKELMHGLLDSRRILKSFKPDIVIGTGGYVCGPIVYTASRMGIPTVIHEQNVYPGLTNRILSNYVDRILVTFAGSEKYFKQAPKIVLTGNPIRKDIISIDRFQSYKDLNITPNIPFILSFGGSGGQKSLNNAMVDFIKVNKLNNNIQLLHITGNRFYDEFMKNLEYEQVSLKSNIKIFPYLYKMPQALNIADLVIASAGAISLAEISAIGIPSILIPKEYTADNHQEFNARAFVKEGASYMILEKDLNGIILNNMVNKLISNKDLLNEMRIKSKSLGKVDSTHKIVDILQELI